MHCLSTRRCRLSPVVLTQSCIVCTCSGEWLRFQTFEIGDDRGQSSVPKVVFVRRYEDRQCIRLSKSWLCWVLHCQEFIEPVIKTKILKNASGKKERYHRFSNGERRIKIDQPITSTAPWIFIATIKDESSGIQTHSNRPQRWCWSLGRVSETMMSWQCWSKEYQSK